MEQIGKLYKCDPSKNKQCKKTNCYLNGGPCTNTTDINYAKSKKAIDLKFQQKKEKIGGEYNK